MATRLAAPIPASSIRDGAPALVFVAGSGRSGTSLFSGLLQRLGFLVPPPEVPADPTNPRGFGESQWVVDFHTRLLARARVQVSDARPAAWAVTASTGMDPAAEAELTAWLAQQFKRSPDVIIKDPRLSWFLPLWRRCAADLGIEARVVTMLRHPAAVMESKQRSYGRAQGDVARLAGWLNLTLATERATRDLARAFVRYDDLLEDWPRAVGRVGRELRLDAVRDAPAPAVRAAGEFLDHSLRRSHAEWSTEALAPALRDLADATWAALAPLADEGTPDDAALARSLDALRAEYQQLYADAEAIAQSSVVASRGGRPAVARPGSPFAVRLVRRVPVRYRRRVPVGLRARVARVVVRRRPR